MTDIDFGNHDLRAYQAQLRSLSSVTAAEAHRMAGSFRAFTAAAKSAEAAILRELRNHADVFRASPYAQKGKTLGPARLLGPAIVVRLALGLTPRWPVPRGSVTSVRKGHALGPTELRYLRSFR